MPGVEFLVLLDGTIKFQGSASELLASKDPYLTEYPLQDAAAVVTRAAHRAGVPVHKK